MEESSREGVRERKSDREDDSVGVGSLELVGGKE